jgi:hypothetical protein
MHRRRERLAGRGRGPNAEFVQRRLANHPQP